MITKDRSTKIVNSMTAGAGFRLLERGHICHIGKMQYFLKNLLYAWPKWLIRFWVRNVKKGV